jgi:serine/threonine-protein phosphatase 2A activator
MGAGLSMLEVFTEEDLPALVFKVFNKYLALARKIQMTYSLEPAGSHGVWGLDDHQFLPYVFGSAQLIGTFAKSKLIVLWHS